MRSIVAKTTSAMAALAFAIVPTVVGARGAYADLGIAPETMRVRIAVVMRYRNEAALQHLIATRGTIRAAQFRDAFAPTDAAYRSTIVALQKRGLRIEGTYGNRTVIDASGSPATIARAFGTRIDAVRERTGRLSYTNVEPAIVPAEIATAVYGIAGLDGRRLFEPTYRRFAGSLRAVSSDVKSGMQGPDSGFGPRTYAKAYDFPVFHKIPGSSTGAVYDGTGQAAAIVIDADFKDSDLAHYLKYFKITPTGPGIVRIPIQGGPAKGISRDSIETMLDVDTILGTAPGVALSLYEPNQLTLSAIIDAYNQIDSDDTVGAVNSSFGGCEGGTQPAYFPALSDYLAMQGAALGIVFSASSGDTGAVACQDGTEPDGVETPASGPHFIAVGGTSLIASPTDGAYEYEFGWSGSGGGVSAFFATPTYQTGVGGVVGTTRNLPDVAFEADPGAGESMYIGGQWIGPVGGTSLASPLFVSLATELAQYHGASLGDMHAPIYATFASDGYTLPTNKRVFRDVTSGFNGFYNALSGYDLVTGIGSINGWNYATSGQL